MNKRNSRLEVPWTQSCGFETGSDREDGFVVEIERGDGRDGWCRVESVWRPGDHLWVKETWADGNSECGPALLYRADGALRTWHEWCVKPGSDCGAGRSMNYDAYPGEYAMWWTDLLDRDVHEEPGYKWRTPMAMPEWASRFRLRVVRVSPEKTMGLWFWRLEVQSNHG